MLFITITVSAQQLAVESFSIDEQDQTARISSPRKDQNDRVCAIVKMETLLLLQDFTFDAGSVGITHTEQRTGEIWIYLSPGTQRLTIQHKHLGTIRNYGFGEALREATVYILKLKSGTVRTVIEENVQLQYFEVDCAIDGATISIDDADPEPIINRKFSKLLSYGKHRYTIEAPLYHPLHGIMEITARKQLPLVVVLQPALGSIVVNTRPEQGADVFVDGVKRGQSPLELDKMYNGEHSIRVMKTLYLPANAKTTVSDGQTATLDIDMKPNYAVITFVTDGDIYVNDEYKATGTWQGRLSPGSYKVEVRKASHRSSFTTVEVKADEIRTVEMEAPVPVYGSLDITANVTAQIYVDGQPTGETTPYLMNQVLASSHRIELRSNGYQPYRQTVEIQEGKRTNMQVVLQKSLVIRSTPGCVASTIDLEEVGFVSNNTWEIENQMWSAPVTATYCEKATFNSGTEGNYREDCRRHPQAKYGHLFSWCMVANYDTLLCPSPWRVPNKADFDRLEKNTTGSYLTSQWGLSGYARASQMANVESQGYILSRSEYSSVFAYNLGYHSNRLSVEAPNKQYGMQVRCVSDGQKIDNTTKTSDESYTATTVQGQKGKQKGFHFIWEGLYLGEYGWGSSAAIGYRFNYYVALSAGGGYVKYTGENFEGAAIPLFADLRINISRSSVSPYVALTGGVYFDSYNTDQYTDNGRKTSESKATYEYYNASAGLSMRTGSTILHVGAGYNNIVNTFALSAGFALIL
ncbi:MAG: PEGA domain-containing protein [Prevotellaceae bacterium]|nr:PEGA domain-containing protein [Prevotellaceae bacterium]